MGETVAAAMMAASARRATDPGVREVLSSIADDEARHAALSWRLVQWAIDAGGAEVADAVDAAVDAALTADVRVEGAVQADDLTADGRLAPALARQVARDAVAGIVRPARRALRRAA